MALTIRRHESFDAPGLAVAWERLSRVSPRAGVFSSYAWCRAWAETVGCDAAISIITCHDAADQVVGLLPACIARTGPVRWLKFLGRDEVSGDHLDMLATAADRAACLDAVLDYVGHGDFCDGLVLGELEADSLTHARIAEWAAARGYPVQERERRVVPYVALPDSLEGYLTSLSANMRYHVRRRGREVAKLPGAATRVLRGATDVERGLADLFRLHELRWGRDGLPGNFRNPAKREFLRRFCAAACEGDQVRCHVLAIHDEVQGVLLAFHWGDTASYYQMGWNPDGPLASPGVILLAESIKLAIDEGLQTYDFLRGDEDYKRKWTARFVEQTTLVVGLHATARMALAANVFGGRIKNVVRQTVGTGNWERMKKVLGAGVR
jgi:CelD/BcsL family acetyltransferase involved in cellulose biosynthesis